MASGSCVCFHSSSCHSLSGCSRIAGSPEVRNAFADAPMAIQVVARKGYDGMLCEALESIDEVLKRGRGSSKL
jgi:hypothetical protein